MANASLKGKMNTQRGTIIWLTGLPASGKSTIATKTHEKLSEAGFFSYVLDGDKMRQGLCSDLGYSPQDRSENIRRVSEVARLLSEAGCIVFVAFISPYRRDRQKARQRADEGRFIEVFVDCPLEVCQKRDPKGLYAKAKRGELAYFTGVSAPYEAPLNPEIHLPTHELTVEECVKRIVGYIGETMAR